MVSAKGSEKETVGNPRVAEIFPEVWEANPAIPATVRNYMNQAHRTLANPDASVVMSGSSIDAMLKEKKIGEGHLHDRIDKAVTEGLLTKTMADWAHRVRFDSNNPRHADKDNPHLNADDAKRAFDYAKALAEYLYVLPSRMPPDDGSTQG